MSDLTFFIFLIGLSIILWKIGDWLVHVSQVKDSSSVYGWGNYQKFIREFEKCEWDNEDGEYKYSMWDRERGAKFHASIIEFNNIGMIINNPIDYVRVDMYVKKFYKNKFGVKKKNIHTW